jgi:predicted metalloendopeptidase
VNRRQLLVLATALACAAPRPPPPAAPPAAASTARLAPPPAVAGIDPSIVTRDVDPCQDFYQFACGGLLEKTVMPPDQSRWVRSFNVMREENRARLHAILEAAAAGPVDPEDRHGQQVADLYASCMDEAAVEKKGLASLQEAWKRLGSVKDARSLSATVGRLHAERIDVLFVRLERFVTRGWR